VAFPQAGAGLSPAVVNKVAKELRDLQLKPEEGIRVSASIYIGFFDKTCTQRLYRERWPPTH